MSDDEPSKASLAVADALRHPLRVRILMRMNAPTRRLSPSVWSKETGVPLGDCAYHFRVLKKSNCIKLVDTAQKRGATEHLYEPVKRAMAWKAEWEKLGPVVRQTLAASILRGAVERIGTAIDGGTFDARDDSHLTWDTAYVDERTWQQIHPIFQRALEETMTVLADNEERIKDLPPDQKFLITYLLSTFESPVPKEGEEA